jgi:hypothetical protein
MNISKIRTNIIALQKRRLDLEYILIRSRKKMEPGSLIKVFTSCRKGNCKCTKGEKHGPFLYLNQKIDSKYSQRYIGKESDKTTVKRVQAYMNFQDTLAILRKINKEIDSLLNLYRNTLSVTPKKND